MTNRVTFRPDGDSLSVTLPAGMTGRLGVREGDTAYAVETESGILLATDNNTAQVMEAAVRISTRYENALRKLASS